MTRPKPVEIPPGFPIVKCPDGKAQGTGAYQWNRPTTGVSKPKPRKLFKVSVKCDCGVENALMLTKAQLRRARAKCTSCGADIGTRWTNVRGV
jgi:hypothetical protein